MTRIDWDLLMRYLAGACTPSEREWIERMAAAHPEIADAVAAARDVARDGDAALSDAAVAARLAAVKRPAVDREALELRPRAAGRGRVRAAPRFFASGGRRSRMGIAAGLALVLAAGLGAGWLGLRGSARPDADAERAAFSVISTARGQRLSLRLSDGTLVALAPASTLRTPGDYGRRHRVVELQGEAAFTVTHDSTRPFAVRTARAVATDLGTHFLVRAYPDDPATDIVVAEGQVAVRPTTPGVGSALPEPVILGRRERVRLVDGGRLERSRGVALDDYFAWTEGRLVFRGTSLREAATRLARWYDVDIRLEPEAIGHQRIFAVAEHEPVVDVLRTLAVSLDLRLARAGRVFTLAPN